MKAAIGILWVTVSLPISFYIQYSLLKAIQADRLLWFLFWVNLPLVVLVSIVAKLMENDK